MTTPINATREDLAKRIAATNTALIGRRAEPLPRHAHNQLREAMTILQDKPKDRQTKMEFFQGSMYQFMIDADVDPKRAAASCKQLIATTVCFLASYEKKPVSLDLLLGEDIHPAVTPGNAPVGSARINMELCNRVKELEWAQEVAKKAPAVVSNDPALLAKIAELEAKAGGLDHDNDQLGARLLERTNEAEALMADKAKLESDNKGLDGLVTSLTADLELERATKPTADTAETLAKLDAAEKLVDELRAKLTELEARPAVCTAAPVEVQPGQTYDMSLYILRIDCQKVTEDAVNDHKAGMKEELTQAVALLGDVHGELVEAKFKPMIVGAVELARTRIENCI